jgi:hypothetical protein
VNLGDVGPGVVIAKLDPPCSIMLIDVDRPRLVDGLRDEAAEAGNVGGRDGGFWRIRRNPERPSPWSWSVMRGDLDHESPSVSRTSL